MYPPRHSTYPAGCCFRVHHLVPLCESPYNNPISIKQDHVLLLFIDHLTPACFGVRSFPPRGVSQVNSFQVYSICKVCQFFSIYILLKTRLIFNRFSGVIFCRILRKFILIKLIQFAHFEIHG